MSIIMGDHSYGGIQIVGDGDISIGKFCSIADNVRAYFYYGHQTGWVTTYPFPAIERKTGNGMWDAARGIDGYEIPSRPIVIQNDVWIGANVTISGGVTICNGACIGAHSVVTNDVFPYTVVGGNPANILYHRFSPEQTRELVKIQWWDWPDEKINKYIPLLCSGHIDRFIDKALEDNNDSFDTNADVQ